MRHGELTSKVTRIRLQLGIRYEGRVRMMANTVITIGFALKSATQKWINARHALLVEMNTLAQNDVPKGDIHRMGSVGVYGEGGGMDGRAERVGAAKGATGVVEEAEARRTK